MKLKEGDRVVRSKSWCYGTQDCDENQKPTIGTITAVGDFYWVVWDCGKSNTYRDRHIQKYSIQMELFDEI